MGSMARSRFVIEFAQPGVACASEEISFLPMATTWGLSRALGASTP